MDKEQKLGMVFDSLADELNISTTMFDKAETAYNALGDHIKAQNKDWDVSIFPQGSFALGTVIKPTKEEDQYDVDLVVLVKLPDFSASDLRVEIRSLLETRGAYQGKIEDKKPCIRIQYADSAQFHMDIASARPHVLINDGSVEISRLIDNSYIYMQSNPIGYIEWFKKAMSYEKILLERSQEFAQTEIRELELPHIRTPLQKAIQILKRHRDIFFFEKDDSDYKPDSIIITTLCAMVYSTSVNLWDSKSNVYNVISDMLHSFFIHIKYDEGYGYVLFNPTNNDENFLRKWNEDKKYKQAFDMWINKARMDIVANPMSFIEEQPTKLNEQLRHAFGDKVSMSALEKYGQRMGLMASNGELRFNAEKATLTTQTEDKSYKPHTYFGGTNDR